MTENPWRHRMEALCMATGWSNKELARRLGISDYCIFSIRSGRTRIPRMKFVRSLNALESSYAQELQAVKTGGIVYTPNDWGTLKLRRLIPRRPGRAEDLEALG